MPRGRDGGSGRGRSLRAVPSSLLRIALALVVLWLLVRAGRVAWSRRDLARDVWRSIRPRHVLGSLGLLVVVIGVAVTAAAAVPLLGRGVGDLFATQGNAVFAPVDVAADLTAVGTTAGVGVGDLVFLGVVTLFLGLLATLLPWFAFVEEEVFRAGAESWSLSRRVAAALVFGAAHLIMLVPVSAALGISVAGFVYGEVYRRGVARRDGAVPPSVRSAFRPTRRSQAAVLATVPTHDPLGAAVHVRRQVAGLHASTVWHATFNTTVVVLVWLSFALDVLLG